MRSLIRCLTLLLALSAAPAWAQEATPAPSEAAPIEGEAAPTEAKTDAEINALITILEDETARKALVEQLRQSAGEAVPKEPVKPEAEAQEEHVTFSRAVAQATQNFIEGALDRLERVQAQLALLPVRIKNLDGNEFSVLWDTLKNLAVLMAIVFGLYFVLRRYSRSIYRRLNQKADGARFGKRMSLWLGTSAVDLLTLIVAWAVGYGVALWFIGESGNISVRQSMFLNAFLLVGLFKVAVRLFITPSAPNLRTLPVSDTQARYLSQRIAWLAGILGYGQLLVVPVINANVSYNSAQLLSTAIAVSVVLYLIWTSVKNREGVARWLAGQKAPGEVEAAEQGADFADNVNAVEIGEQEVPAPAEPEELVRLEDTATAQAEAEQEYSEEISLAAAPNPTDPLQSVLLASPPPKAPRGPGFLARLARYWYIPVVIYLAVMLVTVLVQPPRVVFKSFVSSGQMLLLVMFGTTLSQFLNRVTENGLPIPRALSEQVPMIQERLDRFVPFFLGAIRYMILFCALLLVLDMVTVIDLPALLSSPAGLQLVSVVLTVFVIIAVAFMIWLAMTSWVYYRLNPAVGKVATAREATLLVLFLNAATIALLVITLMVILSEIGVDIAPLLASAGVLGLAVGFGAQKLVQDIITGVFIQIENAMNVGDTVALGAIQGKVEKLTIRSVSIRDKTGAFHIIPFSSVDMVTSYARDFGYYLCDMGVGYSEDADTVKAAMIDAFAEMMQDEEVAERVLDDLEWHGLQTFGDSAVMFRIRIKTTPGDQWAVGRAYNGILKRIFDEREIEIPFPHQTIYFGDAGDKETGPAKLAGKA